MLGEAGLNETIRYVTTGSSSKIQPYEYFYEYNYFMNTIINVGFSFASAVNHSFELLLGGLN